MRFLARILIITTVFWLGCSAQNNQTSAVGDTSLERKVELQIRSYFNIPPNVNVNIARRSPSEIPGYDKLDITMSLGARSSTHQFLISKDNSTLVRWEKLDLNNDPMKMIDLSGRPWRGNKDAKVVIVNYDDFQCPFCSRMHQTLFPNILKTYGDQVKIVYKDFPLTAIHPWAMHAAIDANCLAQQNSDAYWTYADFIHNNQRAMAGKGPEEAFGNLDKAAQDEAGKHKLDEAKLTACLKKQDETAVRESMVQGDKIGVDSTPTLFINGERVSGYVPEEDMRAMIDRALADAEKTTAAKNAQK